VELRRRQAEGTAGYSREPNGWQEKGYSAATAAILALVRRRTDLLAVAFLALLILIFWADILVGGKALYIRDIARVYYPERAVLAEILRGGEFPFWNPRFAGGQPLAANPTGEVFYPPQWLVLLPDLNFAVSAEIVLHFVLGALGMYFFLRRLRLRAAASAFGAVTFAFSGLMLSLANLLPCLFIVAWLPWLAMFTRRYAEERRARDFVLAALTLGVMLLIAEPATVLQSAALMTLYLAWRLRARGVAIAAAIGLAALLVGSAQIVPSIDFQHDSGRSEPFSFRVASTWKLAPLRPLELVLPATFGRFTSAAVYYWELGNPSKLPWLFSWYSGLVAAALAIAGFVRRIRGWAFTAVVCAVSYTFAVYPLHYVLGVRFIRFPEKFFIGAAFALMVFAAIAADRFLDDAEFRRTTFRVSLVLVAVAAIALAFAWSPLFPRAWNLTGYIDDILTEARAGAMATLATAAALALILVFRERPRIALPLLGALVLADLGPGVYGIAPRTRADFYDPPAIAQGIPRGARLYNDIAWRVALLPLPAVSYDDRITRMRNSMATEMQALWGFESMFELDVTQTMLKPTEQLNRAFWAAQFGRQTDEVRRMLAAAGVTHVVAMRDPTSPTHPAFIVPLPGTVRWFVDGGGRIVRAAQSANTLEFDLEATAPSRLVVAVTRHKYWSATVDGAPAAIHPANIAFQSIDVPAGRHRVAMRYRNPLIVIFGVVSLVSALALVAVALRSKALPPPSPR
jgi:hypothetical protein